MTRSWLFVACVVLCPSMADACWRPFRCCQPRPTPIQIVEPVKPAAVVLKEGEAPEGWCHIKGRVVFEGDPIPEQKEIPRSGGAYTEEWVVNKSNRGVKNVVVWLAPEPTADEMVRLRDNGPNRLRDFPTFKLEQVYPDLSYKGEYTLAHAGVTRAYIPHIVAAQGGSKLTIRNSTNVPNNVKWLSRKNDELNPLLQPFGTWQSASLVVEKFPIEIASDIFPWMKAWLRVFDHPYFAVTNEDGEFTIRFAPKGKLRLFVWQETAGLRNGKEGRFGEAIHVPSGKLDLGELKIKLPKW